VIIGKYIRSEARPRADAPEDGSWSEARLSCSHSLCARSTIKMEPVCQINIAYQELQDSLSRAVHETSRTQYALQDKLDDPQSQRQNQRGN
jgi:hypothetical protein